MQNKTKTEHKNQNKTAYHQAPFYSWFLKMFLRRALPSK